MKTIAELAELREASYAKVHMREDNKETTDKVKRHVLLCGGTDYHDRLLRSLR